MRERREFYLRGKFYSSNKTSFTQCWLHNAKDLVQDDFIKVSASPTKTVVYPCTFV